MEKLAEHKKKVCFLMERRGLYDDRAYWKQAVALHKAGYEIYYLVISHTETSSKGITSEGINYQVFEGVKYIPSVLGNYIVKKFLPLQTEFDQLLRQVVKIKPSLIQIVDLRILRILEALQTKLPKTKFIYDIREPRDANLLDIRMKTWNIPYTIKKKYANYIQQWEYQQAKKCDYLLGVDDGIARRINYNLPEMPYQTLYNFTNLADQREYIPLQDRKYHIAYVGGLSEIRGAKTILEATQIASETFPNIQLLLLGKSFDPMLSDWIENFIHQHSLSKNVTWIRGVEYQEVSSYYNQVQIGLNPLKDVLAHHDIIQIKLFEYMNYGIPIITSNFGAMQKYIQENEVGECIEPDKPEVLATSIVELLKDKGRLEQYSRNGYNAVNTKYNWSLMEKKYIQIVKDLLS